MLEKRRQPQDDMISFLTQVEYEALGRKLTDLEINGIVYAMVIGGLETTQYALEEQAQLLCEQPGVFAQLKGDRDKMRAVHRRGHAAALADPGAVHPHHEPGRSIPGCARSGGFAAASALGGGQHRRGRIRVPATNCSSSARLPVAT